MNIWVPVILAIAIFWPRKQRPTDAPTLPVAGADEEERDANRIQIVLFSLNRRIGEVEATAGGLAAVQVVLVTYLPERFTSLHIEEYWSLGSFVLLALAVGIALIAAFIFKGEELPDPSHFIELRSAGRREEALRITTDTMLITYRFNQRQLRRKEALRTTSVFMAASVVAIYLAAVVGWFK